MFRWQHTSNQSSADSSWPALVIRCLNKPYLYLKPYPHAGKFKVAIESRKQEASLPRPPLPSAASFSYTIKPKSPSRYIGMQVSKIGTESMLQQQIQLKLTLTLPKVELSKSWNGVVWIIYKSTSSTTLLVQHISHVRQFFIKLPAPLCPQCYGPIASKH